MNDYLNILQGELVFVEHPNPNRQGWYQKLRAENKKVRYFKISSKEEDQQIKIYAPDTLENPYHNRYSEAKAIMVIRGGENVSRFIASNFDLNVVKVVEYIEITILINMKLIPQHILDNPEKYIPQGIYCYTNGRGNRCPFWDCDNTKHWQENGYCHYLKYGDWESEYLGLLWDQVKECGINDDLD